MYRDRYHKRRATGGGGGRPRHRVVRAERPHRLARPVRSLRAPRLRDRRCAVNATVRMIFVFMKTLHTRGIIVYVLQKTKRRVEVDRRTAATIACMYESTCHLLPFFYNLFLLILLLTHEGTVARRRARFFLYFACLCAFVLLQPTSLRV